jgi:hypothetical protein
MERTATRSCCRPTRSWSAKPARRPLAWSNQARAPRGEAEAVLRDVAFVLHLTRSVKQAIISGRQSF